MVQRLLHYEIVDKLGEGGMGVVYKARDTKLNRLVALKLLLPDRVADPERRRRFMQEAQAASALNHPNIITIHDIAHAEGADFIVMEYVAGSPLDRLIRPKGLPFREALKLAIEIADALSAAHAAGIIHRDLKPGNIMVSDEGRVKVLDFGLAKLNSIEDPNDAAPTQGPSMETEPGTILGTIAYLAPEQAEGKKVDARADIFSFGSILYEMLTGQRAFRGDSKVATMAAVLREEPRPPGELVAGLPREMERLIHRCLRKNPSERAQNMKDLKFGLEELLEDSQQAPLTGDLPRERRRSWFRQWAAAAVVLIAGAAVLFYLLSRREPTLTPLTPESVTTYPGIEGYPSLSPDGKQVAFSWNGEHEDNFDIYVKLVDAGDPIRLTSGAASEERPVWSPDGRFIAFARRDPNAGYFVIPALGGPERKIAEIARYAVGSLGAFPGMDWTPDGRSLIIVDSSTEPQSLTLVSVDTLQRRKVLSPLPNSYGDFNPAVSPDGKWLVFVRILTNAVGDIYRIGLSPSFETKGEPTRLTFDQATVLGLAWTTDSRDIIYGSARKGAPLLWRMRADGSTATELVAGVGRDVSSPTIARYGHRLAYVNSFTDFNVWRTPIRGSGDGHPERLIASSRNDWMARYSPDGQRIAFVSNRSGSNEIWVADADGRNAVQLTRFGGPTCTNPMWSPDGKQIAFASRPQGNVDVYIISTNGGAPQRVTNHPAEDSIPTWSPDGKWMYFRSRRNGADEIWKIAVDKPAEVFQVTRNGGITPRVSPDGRFLYYYKFQAPGIWKMPVDGGAETQVLDTPVGSYWDLSATGIYYLDAPSRSARFFRFADGQIATIGSAERVPGHSMAISASPDERWLLHTKVDQNVSDLYVVENFK